MINNFKDLNHLLKMCRLHGVTEIALGGDSIKLGPAPEKRTRSKRKQDDDLPFPTDGITPEQLAFYSVDSSNEDIQI